MRSEAPAPKDLGASNSLHVLQVGSSVALLFAKFDCAWTGCSTLGGGQELN